MLNQIGFRVQKDNTVEKGMGIRIYKEKRNKNENDLLIGEFSAKFVAAENKFVVEQQFIPADNPFMLTCFYPVIRQWLRKIKPYAPEAQAILDRPRDYIPDAGGNMELGDTVGLRLVKGDSDVGEQQQPESSGGQRNVEGTLPVSGENVEPRNETAEETKPSDGTLQQGI